MRNGKIVCEVIQRNSRQGLGVKNKEMKVRVAVNIRVLANKTVMDDVTGTKDHK